MKTAMHRLATSILTRARRLVRDEGGAGTTLAYLMVIPVYLLTFLVILETCFMLLAQVGLAYAAFAAARAAVVRRSDDVGGEEVRQAAVAAFVPFASSLRPAAPANDPEREAYVAAFAEEATGRGARVGGAASVGRQHADASARLRITAVTDVVGEPWEEDLTMTVSYAYPFTIPLVGRMFAAVSPGGVFELRGEAVLPMEHAENPDGELGITYGTP